jgi:hypothetical protein
MAAATCDAAGIAAAALAPAGGLQSEGLASLNPHMLFFAALVDFAYEQDLGGVSRRKSAGPCLSAWGAQEHKRISTNVSQL